MITCREFIDFLDDYTDGRLPLTKKVSFEAHLLVCRSCRDYLADYRASMAMLRALCDESPGAPPTGVPESLVNAVRAAMLRS